jgi:glycosyltransferase involved in cell wall biosynthesis
MLTVSIPTYNRPKQLLDCVGRLLPQLDDDCELRIYDNCSTTPMAGVLADLLKHYPKAKVTVIRNQTNIGMLGNIIRCMEDCPTPWLAMCGDDDPPDPDFVAKVKRAIAQYPEAIFVSFSLGSLKRSSSFPTNGLSEFVRADYSLGPVLSISADVFRMEALKPFMSSAYMYAYTLGPHIAIVLAALRAKGGQCAFVAERLADCGQDFSLESWHKMWLMSLVLLLELIPDPADREAFSKKLMCYTSNQTYLANFLIENSLKTKADNSFIFATRMKLRSLLIPSFFASLNQQVFSLLVKNPAWGLRVIKFLNRRKRNPVGFDGSKENLFERI